jgi:hypothetical protein
MNLTSKFSSHVPIDSQIDNNITKNDFKTMMEAIIGNLLAISNRITFISEF